MSFVLTLVAEAPDTEIRLVPQQLVVEEAVQDARAAYRAGYLVGLTRHLGRDVQGWAFHVRAQREDGYVDSRPLVHDPFDEEDEEGIYLAVPAAFRGELEALLYSLLAASRMHRVLVILEWNGAVTSPKNLYGPGPNEQEALLLACEGVEAFWSLHDAHGIKDASITTITG